MRRDERGSAVVESLFGIFVLLFLVVGTIQVALTLYARNVLMAAVHDGARAAVEVNAPAAHSSWVARDVIERAAGSLVRDLVVVTETGSSSDRYIVRVIAGGHLEVPGPIPLDIPVEIEASSSRELFDADR